MVDDREMAVWRCTTEGCGNLLMRAERPTRCFHCRTGEIEEDRPEGVPRLFEPVPALTEVLADR